MTRLAVWMPDYARQYQLVRCKVCDKTLSSWKAFVDTFTGDILCSSHEQLADKMLDARKEKGWNRDFRTK